MIRFSSLLLLLFLALASSSAQQTVQQQQSPVATLKDKDFLRSYYQQTFDALKKSTDRLSTAQLHWKPAADKWSISQCLEHIVLTERMLFDYAKQAMEKPANPARRSEVKAKDEDIIKGINDRSFKAKATEDITGKNQLESASKALNELQKDRRSVFAYLANVKEEDLRNHISDSPFGPVDAYQSFLFIAGHTSRHTLQIEEIKADMNFPAR